MSSDLSLAKPVDFSTLQLSTAKKLGDPSKASSKDQLKKAAGEFESVFMDIVMKSMRDTVGTSEESGDTEKVKFFQSMLDSEYSKIVSSKSKMGLANLIVKQLTPKESPLDLSQTGVKP